ncbi:SDR family NAD(P)-dependent oxidoreductase [Azohydromonas caseinilytica]|uniref:SDR family NAD(P)-dependent oxidoreductase n=1 Tax=Azohydromonas caseinilytica TaxID=2728836 RepID=A0A848FIA9_9BURK|nr:SDR family NAD(P)-dependent oxidoreductase [Azohydromonas caseinilytica]NML18009.1 SDR family NAD(P)-dependent oxidoreductase [Azohydromonas caseinilytica]
MARPTLPDLPVVVITGGSSGMGLAAAQRLAQQGARLVLNARAEDTLADAAERCRALGAEVLTVAADVADAPAMEALAQQAAERFGRIDAWINAAGTSLWGLFDAIPAEAHERLIRTNLLGVVHGTHAALQHMRGRAGGGVIVNIASIAGHVPMPLAASYTASKFGVAGFTDALRDELSGKGIAVCGVYPSFVDTPTPHRSANYTGRVLRPVPPVLDPERVAEDIVGLLSRPRRALRPGVHNAAALAYALAPDTTGRATARAAERFFLQSGERQPDDDGALFTSKPLPAAVHGAWGLRERREAGAVTATTVAVGAVALLTGWLLTGSRRRGRA